MKKRNSPIGVFDSGIGGLTVVKEIIKALPAEDIIYFGDTARVPYGNKSAQTIIRFSLENVRFLLRFGVKLIVVACNTSSSVALPALRKGLKIPVVGVIRPAVSRAVEVSSAGRIGIIATHATISSRSYQQEIKRINSGLRSFTQACPLFVPLVEEGWLNNGVTAQVARTYLRPLIGKNIDTLILGCTHYPLLKGILQKTSGNKIRFVDSASETAKEVKEILTRDRLRSGQRARSGRCRFYVSDDADRFMALGKRFLGKSIRSVQCIR
jgi:glutamate racemase